MRLQTNQYLPKTSRHVLRHRLFHKGAVLYFKVVDFLFLRTKSVDPVLPQISSELWPSADAE